VVEKVDPERLDAIAAAHDLVLVATGRGPLAELFPRNAERSVYDRPQRKLAMMIVTGAPQAVPGVPFLPIKFNFFAPCGEVFWVPYYHRDHGPAWCVLFDSGSRTRCSRTSSIRAGSRVRSSTSAPRASSWRSCPGIRGAGSSSAGPCAWGPSRSAGCSAWARRMWAPRRKPPRSPLVS
jgi:hypothetical protein